MAIPGRDRHPPLSEAPAAALVTVGDEILLGRTVDTNAAWLGRRLEDLGVRVVRRHTVGDDVDEIRWAVGSALARAPLAIVGGGLGPTPDDVTREAVASLLGRVLHVDPSVLADIRRRFRPPGRPGSDDADRRVASVPEGARVLPNLHGTAPGLALEVGGAGSIVVLLPGVPRELRGIVDASLAPLLVERFGDRLRPVRERVIRTTGAPESVLAGEVERLLPADTGPVRLAFLPDERGVDLRLIARGVGGEEAEGWFDRIERALEPALAPWRFRAGSGDLAEAVTDALRRAGRTVAVAESCTGGLVLKRLTDGAGASDVVVGGVVAYADRVKAGALDVSRDAIARHGAVSEAVARAMAAGVAARLGASAGVGVTGVAGPAGGSEAKPVGTVWYAVALDGRTTARHERFPGDRSAVRERAAQAALALLLRALDGSVEAGG